MGNTHIEFQKSIGISHNQHQNNQKEHEPRRATWQILIAARRFMSETRTTLTSEVLPGGMG